METLKNSKRNQQCIKVFGENDFIIQILKEIEQGFIQDDLDQLLDDYVYYDIKFLEDQLQQQLIQSNGSFIIFSNQKVSIQNARRIVIRNKFEQITLEIENGKSSLLKIDFQQIKQIYIGDDILIFITEIFILPLLKQLSKMNLVLEIDETIFLKNINQNLLKFTQDSLGYLIYRIRQTFNKDIVIHINTQKQDIINIKENLFKSLYSQLRGNCYPNYYNKRLITQHQLKNDVILVPIGIEYLYTIYQQLLNQNVNLFDKQTQAYIEKVKTISIENQAFLAGHWSTLQTQGNKFIKKINNKELHFYQSIYPALPQTIKQYIPQVYQIKEIDSFHYLESEFVTYENKYNIMDIKMSAIDKSKYDSLEVWSDYWINICGTKFINEKQEVIEKQSKQYLYLPLIDYLQIIDRFFMENQTEKIVKEKTIQSFIDKIKEIIKCCQQNEIYLEQISFLMLFDIYQKSFKFYLIDFPYVKLNDKINQIQECLNGFVKFLQKYLEFLKNE